jgi:hypothetical protein
VLFSSFELVIDSTFVIAIFVAFKMRFASPRRDMVAD